VTEVALASGFSSVRRFNALFRSRYRMAPGTLRRERGESALPATLAFELAYRPPYDWDSMLAFLAARAIAGVEAVIGDRYARTLALAHRGVRHAGRIEVRHARRRNALRVAVSPSLSRAVPAVISRVKHAFDLGCEPSRVAATLGPLAASHPGLRVPGTVDGFEVAARAVIGQQISVPAARTLLGRIARRFGEALPGEAQDAPDVVFPDAARLAAAAPADLAEVGLPAARARTLIGVAAAVAAKRVVLEPESDVDATVAALEALPGIGDWTASYIAMRALRWPDAFLASDLGVLRALGETKPARAERAAEAWRPWRAYAVIHLWRNAA